MNRTIADWRCHFNVCDAPCLSKSEGARFRKGCGSPVGVPGRLTHQTAGRISLNDGLQVVCRHGFPAPAALASALGAE